MKRLCGATRKTDKMKVEQVTGVSKTESEPSRPDLSASIEKSTDFWVMLPDGHFSK